MKNFYKSIPIIGAILLGSVQIGAAQDLTFQQYNNPGIIQIAGPGELADTLNVWGDIRVSGRYVVPRRTNLTELISMAKGPSGFTSAETWTNVELQIYVTSYNESLGRYQTTSFDVEVDAPFPEEMRNFPLRNGDVITVKANQKASFRDYFSIIAPVLTLGFTTFIVIDRLQN